MTGKARGGDPWSTTNKRVNLVSVRKSEELENLQEN